MADGTRLIFWDTETTGLYPETGDRIVEIALVETDADLNRTGRTLHRYVNPEGRPVGESASIHGLTDEFLADKPTFAQVAPEVLALFDGATILAHNLGFDLRFMVKELARLNLENTYADAVDTLVVARRRFPGEPASLDALIRKFGIDGKSRTKHSAMLDTDLLVEVYAHLSGRTSLMLEASEAHAGAATGSPRLADQSWFPRRDFYGLLSYEEYARHRAFVTENKAVEWSRFYEAMPSDTEGEAVAAE